MVDTTRLANRPEVIQQIESDPEKATGIIQNRLTLPRQTNPHNDQPAPDYDESSYLTIDPADITLDDM